MTAIYNQLNPYIFPENAGYNLGQGAGVNNRPGIGQGVSANPYPGIGQGAGLSNRPGIGQGVSVNPYPGIGQGAGVSNRPGIGQGVSVNNGQPVGAKPVDNPTNGEYIKYAQHPIGDAISVMLVMMALLQNMANDKLADMQKKSDVSRDAQDMANRVESAMAKITTATGDGSTAKLDPAVIDYLRNNHILVEDKSIDQFLKDKGMTVGKGLPKDVLISIKGSLSSVSDRASDFLQQTQLKMQQVMQNYNTAVQMINSLQSMLAESVKGIASAIR